MGTKNLESTQFTLSLQNVQFLLIIWTLEHCGSVGKTPLQLCTFLLEYVCLWLWADRL